MPIEIKLPELGENLASGDVLDIKVAAGDTVTAGQTLLEVEAEKSTVEVPAPVAGKIAQLLVKKGQSIKVGQTLFLIDEASGGNASKAPAKEPASSAKSEPAPAAKPAEEKPAKAAAEPAPAEAKKESQPAAKAEVNHVPPPAPAIQSGDVKTVPAGPATRRLARELGIDLAQVAATGKNGRVTEDDVKTYVKALASGSQSPGRTGAPALPYFSKWGTVERQPLEGIRKKTAEQMSLAWSLIPHVTQHDLADITELEAFRKQQDTKTTRLTVTAFALKAAAVALQQFPQFNSSLDIAAGQLIQKRYYHIGVAVDTDRGLLVPVFRDVDKKSVHDLAQELSVVAEKARQRKVGLEDLRGGSFTITNLGGIGGTSFTPIVNWPEVAILGISRGKLQPVYRDGQLTPRLMLPLSLSYDHRVIDGADAARFTRRIAEMLENPLLMLLHA